MGFLDSILTDSLGSQGQTSNQSSGGSQNFTSPHPVASMFLNLLGGPFRDIGDMMNSSTARDYKKNVFIPRTTKSLLDAGQIDQKEADWINDQPVEVSMPYLHDLTTRWLEPKNVAPVGVFNQKQGTERFVIPQAGTQLQPGEVTAPFYQKPSNRQVTWVRAKPGGTGYESQNLPEGAPAPGPEWKSLGAASLEERQSATQASQAIQQQNMLANQALRALTEQGLQQQRQFQDFMAQETRRDRLAAGFQNQANSLESQRREMDALQGKATPEALAPAIAGYNARLERLKRFGAATGQDISNLPEPLGVLKTPGAIQKLTGGRFGSATGTAIPAPPSTLGGGSDPLIGKATKQPDGSYHKGGKTYVVKGGRIIGAY